MHQYVAFPLHKGPLNLFMRQFKGRAESRCNLQI